VAIRILVFAGSTRNGSYNQSLAKIAGQGAVSGGAEVTFLNLVDYELPIFNEDLEKRGRPDNVQKLKELFENHDGFLIASPEYNSSISPLLKNTIDWVSRPDEDKPPLSAYQGKIAGIMAASPGALGGLRGLTHLRSILGNIGVTVLPKQMAISRAFEAFDADGNLKDEGQQSTILGIGRTVAEYAEKLKT
jgi:NAD(P)H-dependent FMN reductase